MHFDAICRLSIEDIAASDAGLALWVYGPLLPEAIKLMERWGFTYKSDLITWVKTTATGKLAFGTGYFTRKGTEQLIYGSRGNGLKVVDRSIRQCLIAERREHSRKPDEVAAALQHLFGPVRHRLPRISHDAQFLFDAPTPPAFLAGDDLDCPVSHPPLPRP